MRKEFQVHILNAQGLELAAQMSERFSDLLDWLYGVCESSPELTIASRKLEEASFYAKKAMAQQRENKR